VDWENPRVAAILQAAAKCFSRKGFSATTLAEIGKELGLRKSIVHYYFASKAALIHEVQSFTYHKYLDRLREAIANPPEGKGPLSALAALWEAVQTDKTGTGLNIEVWSAARRDPELKRRASALHRDARQLLAERLPEVLAVKPEDTAKLHILSTLILAVINGLAVSEYLEGEEMDVKEPFELFLQLLATVKSDG
jgi:AcrR family transcriptional regulator